jgi:outer membrane receptor for ferrienterochelin and colicin
MAEQLDTKDNLTDIEVLVVTASGYESTIAEAPASISIVNSEQIQKTYKELRGGCFEAYR